MKVFIDNMPKIELHAHLNGSLSREVLLELGAIKYGTNNERFNALCHSLTHFGKPDLIECFKKFKIAHDVTTTKGNLKRATIYAIRDFALDNVIYLELRTTPKRTEDVSKRDYLKGVLEGIWQAQAQYPNIRVKLIPSIDRSQDLTTALDTLKIIFEFMIEYPDIIKGIDFSGNPKLNKFSTYREVFEKALQADLKLAFHCGEIENDQEVEEMLNFGTFRCGHGTFIKGKNLETLIKNKIPVECCLSSNVKCGTVNSYEEHHFLELFNKNHPVVICTDDFGVFDTTLSKEFLLAHKTFNLQKKDLLTLTTNAIQCSFASEKEKNSLKNIVDAYFENTRI